MGLVQVTVTTNPLGCALLVSTAASRSAGAADVHITRQKEMSAHVAMLKLHPTHLVMACTSRLAGRQHKH